MLSATNLSLIFFSHCFTYLSAVIFSSQMDFENRSALSLNLHLCLDMFISFYIIKIIYWTLKKHDYCSLSY